MTRLALASTAVRDASGERRSRRPNPSQPPAGAALVNADLRASVDPACVKLLAGAALALEPV